MSSGERDVLGCHFVTVGREASRVEKELFKANEYREYLYLHGLSVETRGAGRVLAQASPQGTRHLRRGLARTPTALPAEVPRLPVRFGYPACPNLEDQAQLFELLQPGRIGVSISEEWQLEPEQSTSAIIVHHPAAKYFNIK